MRSNPESWAEYELDEVAVRITKGTTPTSVGFEFTSSGVRFVKVESLSKGRVDHQRCANISEAAHSVLERSQLQASDLLYSIAGTLGRVATVSASDIPANTNQAVAIISPIDTRMTPFLAHALRYLSTQFGENEGRGVGLQT